MKINQKLHFIYWIKSLGLNLIIKLVVQSIQSTFEFKTNFYEFELLLNYFIIVFVISTPFSWSLLKLHSNSTPWSRNGVTNLELLRDYFITNIMNSCITREKLSLNAKRRAFC
jgi:hypothetical protein